ncbi:MAG: hypothetical protein ACFE95_13175 [Candidatus Hodarchaeota archaeon]
MRMDPYYVKAAVEVLGLIENLYYNILQNQSEEQFQRVLNLIEANPISYLGEKHGLGSLVTDKEAKTNYWEGVRDMVKLTRKQWSSLQNHKKFLTFIQKTRSILIEKINNEVALTTPSRQKSHAFDLLTVQSEKLISSISKDGRTERIEDIYSLTIAIKQLNNTIANLPDLLRQEINQMIETKVASELEALKKDILHSIEEKIVIHQKPSESTAFNTSLTPSKLKKFSESNSIGKSVEQSLEEKSAKVPFKENLTNKQEALNRIQAINTKSKKKLLIDDEDFTSLTLRDALKILRDED